jgi:hypothetical protein
MYLVLNEICHGGLRVSSVMQSHNILNNWVGCQCDVHTLLLPDRNRHDVFSQSEMTMLAEQPSLCT